MTWRRHHAAILALAADSRHRARLTGSARWRREWLIAAYEQLRLCRWMREREQ